MKILKLEQIKEILKNVDVISAIEEGFVKFSEGKAVIPPVGEMIFDQPPGDVHIKYGYLRNDGYYVIKIASGFYENPKLGLSSGNGLNLLFNQRTGELKCVLLDEGHLTDIRTAAAGAVAAKYLAPNKVEKIGVFGAGMQARLQVLFLKKIIECSKLMVCGINQAELDKYKIDMEPKAYEVETTMDAAELAAHCNLIITATPSRKPLLNAGLIRPGTHITAMGSDTAEKQELDAEILKQADIVVADSIAQCLVRGEIHHAIKNKAIAESKIIELGNIISGNSKGRISEEQITIVDLTGVAVQDLQISKAVFEASL